MTKDSLLKWAKRDNWFQYRETISELNYNIRQAVHNGDKRLYIYPSTILPKWDYLFRNLDKMIEYYTKKGFVCGTHGEAFIIDWSDKERIFKEHSGLKRKQTGRPAKRQLDILTIKSPIRFYKME